MLKAKIKTDFVQETLLRRSISQNALARSLGVSSAYMSQIMTGQRHAGPRIRRRLMEELGADFDSLFSIVRAEEYAGCGGHRNGVGAV